MSKYMIARLTTGIVGLLVFVAGVILLTVDIPSSHMTLGYTSFDASLTVAGSVMLWIAIAGRRAVNHIRAAAVAARFLVRTVGMILWQAGRGLFGVIDDSIRLTSAASGSAGLAATPPRAQLDVAGTADCPRIGNELDGKYQFYSKIAGVSRSNPNGTSRQDLVRRLQPNSLLSLRREPDNAHDPNAIAVVDAAGRQLGYVTARMASLLAPRLDRGEVWVAFVSAVTGGGEGGCSGCNIAVKYCPPIANARGAQRATTTSKDRQSHA